MIIRFIVILIRNGFDTSDDGNFFQPIWIEAAPRILSYIGIDVRAIHKARRIARNEHPQFKIPVTHPLVEKASGILVLGVGALAVGVGAVLLGAFAEGLVGGGVGEGADRGGAGDHVSAAVVICPAQRAAAGGVKDTSHSPAPVA